MKNKNLSNKWKIIEQIWQVHQENPKYSGDKSIIEIYSIGEKESAIFVNHSFLLNNLKKLSTIMPDLVCLDKNGPVDLSNFSKNNIAQKYGLPNKPTIFSNSNLSISLREEGIKDNKGHQRNHDKEGSLSKLIPLSSKSAETIPIFNENKRNENKSNERPKYLKLAALVTAPLLLFILIYNIVLSPTSDNKKAQVQSRSKAIEQKKNQNRTKKIKTVSKINEIKRPNKKLRKTKPASIKKLNSRRKKLMNKTIKSLPAKLTKKKKKKNMIKNEIADESVSNNEENEENEEEDYDGQENEMRENIDGPDENIDQESDEEINRYENDSDEYNADGYPEEPIND
jgi:hypothetical protein